MLSNTHYTLRSIWLALAISFVTGLSSLPALAQTASTGAARTAAGGVIVNVASVELQVEGVSTKVESNTDSRTVDELLDVRLSSPTTRVPVRTGQIETVPFVLTNAGNGTESFVLDATVRGPGASIEGIAIDRDGDGRFDPAIDLAVPIGTAAPPLPAGGTANILFLVRGSGDPAGSIVVDARAVTGSGSAGTVFAGKGDGGADAVTGATTAAVRVELPLAIGGGGATGSGPALVKTQVVRAPDGSDTPRAGAIITYSIAASFDGIDVAQAARITDSLPAGTRYVAGSMRLDGVALTDIADADGGSFDGAAVAVLLGNVAAPATRIFQFDATIQ